MPNDNVSPASPGSYAAHCAVGCLLTVCLAMAMWAQPLFSDRFIVQGDTITHLRWFVQFQAALQEGVWQPRWAYASHGGLGDPTFLFYQPLLYYLASFLAWLGFSQTKSLIVAAFMPGVFAGAIVFCWMAKRLPLARALMGMAMMVTCPVLFFLSTHYGALPWVMSIPFSILFVLEGVKHRPDPLRVALWLSLICLSHLLSGLIALMCVGGARLVFAFPQRTTLGGHLSWLTGVLLGLCLAAFFVYPALTQQALINPTAWTNDPMLDWHRSFAFPTFSYLQFGFRWLSIQWPLPLFALLMSVFALLQSKRNAASANSSPGQVIAKRLALAALIGLMFSSELAYPLYALVPPLQKLQSPYRFVVLSLVLATIAFASLATLRPAGSFRKNWVQLGGAAAILLQIIFVFILQMNIVKVGVPLLTADRIMAGEFGQPEYLVAQRGKDWGAYNRTGKFPGECSRLGIECTIQLAQGHASTVLITTARSTVVRLPIFAFPGWRLSIDGQAKPIVADPLTGLIAVEVPAGAHQVHIRWGGVAAEHIGNMISLAALIVVGLYLCAGLIMHRRRLKPPQAAATSTADRHRP